MPAFGDAAPRDRNVDRAAHGHGLLRVARQVHEHLLKLMLVGVDRRHRLAERVAPLLVVEILHPTTDDLHWRAIGNAQVAAQMFPPHGKCFFFCWSTLR